MIYLLLYIDTLPAYAAFGNPYNGLTRQTDGKQTFQRSQIGRKQPIARSS